MHRGECEQIDVEISLDGNEDGGGDVQDVAGAG